MHTCFRPAARAWQVHANFARARYYPLHRRNSLLVAAATAPATAEAITKDLLPLFLLLLQPPIVCFISSILFKNFNSHRSHVFACTSNTRHVWRVYTRHFENIVRLGIASGNAWKFQKFTCQAYLCSRIAARPRRDTLKSKMYFNARGELSWRIFLAELRAINLLRTLKVYSHFLNFWNVKKKVLNFFPLFAVFYWLRNLQW